MFLLLICACDMLCLLCVVGFVIRGSLRCVALREVALRCVLCLGLLVCCLWLRVSVLGRWFWCWCFACWR